MSDVVVIRVRAVPSEIAPGVIGFMEPAVPTWVQSCDVDANDGLGRIELTSVRENAIEFPDVVAAFEYWRRPSTVEPLRPDGKPNRPLTMFTIELEDD